MAVEEGTRVVGKVEWTNADRSIAKLRPLLERAGSSWVAASESDYPTRGRVFWPHANNVNRDELRIFNTQANTHGGDDSIVAVDPQLPDYVVDLRGRGRADQVARIVSGPLRLDTVPDRRKVYLWCDGDTLLGPFTVARSGDRATLSASRPEEVLVRAAEGRVLTLPDGTICGDNVHSCRIVGDVDCRSDQDVLRQALRSAAKIVEADSGVLPYSDHKKALIEASTALRVGNSDTERRRDAQRLRRAVDICEDSDTVRSLANELAEMFLGHPQVAARIQQLQDQAVAEAKAQARTEAEATARREIDHALADERAALEQVRKQLAHSRGELKATQAQASEAAHKREALREEAAAAERECAEASAAAAEQLQNLEAAVGRHVAQIVGGASDALAQSVVLRALGSGSAAPSPAVRSSQPASAPLAATTNEPDLLQYSYPAVSAGLSTVDDPRSVAQHLKNTASAWGMPTSALLRLHATVRAGLVPVVTGNGSLSALRAYADAAFGARMAALPVGHDFLHPVDLLGVRADDLRLRRPHHGLFASALAETVEAPGMLVLESFNRAPTESYLLPLLQGQPRQVEIAPSEPVVLHDGLVLAATVAAGATTAPLSPDLWGHAAVVDVPAYPRSVTWPGFSAVFALPPLAGLAEQAGELVDDFADVLDSWWPLDSGVTDAANRLAAALLEVQDEEAAALSLAMCVLLPALATSLSGEELDAATEAVVDCFDGLTEPTEKQLRALPRRLRSRFA